MAKEDETPRTNAAEITLDRRFFPGENPIGHRLLLLSVERTIVGVAADTRHLELDREVRPEVYSPYMQHSEIVRRPDFSAKVNDIVVECGNALYQDVIDRYVAGQEVSRTELQQVWRNTIAFFVWDSLIY